MLYKYLANFTVIIFFLLLLHFVEKKQQTFCALFEKYKRLVHKMWYCLMLLPVATCFMQHCLLVILVVSRCWTLHVFFEDADLFFFYEIYDVPFTFNNVDQWRVGWSTSTKTWTEGEPSGLGITDRQGFTFSSRNLKRISRGSMNVAACTICWHAFLLKRFRQCQLYGANGPGQLRLQLFKQFPLFHYFLTTSINCVYNQLLIM